MYQSNRLVFDAIRSIDSATFTGSYQAVGTSFTYPVRILKIVNNSTKDVTVSLDGSTDNDYIPTGSYATYDAGTNKGTSADVLEFQKGSQIYVKGSAGTGLVYIVTLVAFTPTMTIPQ